MLRVQGPAEVARQVQEVADHGVDHFYFVDSTFNHPVDHALAVCGEVAKLRLQAGWTALIAPLGFRPELAAAMAAAGCRSAEVGSEAGATATLRALGKSHTFSDIALADRWLMGSGITPSHFFVFGGPDETPATVEETLGLIEKLRGVIVAMVGLRLFPRTPLFEHCRREGLHYAETDLLQPTFYLSPGIDPERLLTRLNGFAAAHPRFFVVGQSSKLEHPLIQRLRRKGKGGPLWEYYVLS
jgi:radical SAM superfamily enzyme YgiQ (UPF0313 family)